MKQVGPIQNLFETWPVSNPVDPIQSWLTQFKTGSRLINLIWNWFKTWLVQSWLTQFKNDWSDLQHSGLFCRLESVSAADWPTLKPVHLLRIWQVQNQAIMHRSNTKCYSCLENISIVLLSSFHTDRRERQTGLGIMHVYASHACLIHN